MKEYKFYCTRMVDLNQDCIAPIDGKRKENLPLNCYECQYYIDKKTREAFINVQILQEESLDY